MKLIGFIFDGKRSLKAHKRPPMLKEVDSAADGHGRRWPTLPSAPHNTVYQLESTNAKLTAELNLRCTQVADLYNIQQQQANEILDACDEIDRLGQSIDTLQDTARQRESDAAAAVKKCLLLENENIALRLQLGAALKESAELLPRLLAAETAFNNREIEIVSAQELNSQLKAETIVLAATIEKVDQRHRNEIYQQNAQFKDRMKKIIAVVEERNTQVKYLAAARAELISRCDELAKTVAALETENTNARSEFVSRAVNVFNLVLTEEREVAAAKIKELTSELQRERFERFTARRTSTGIRENVVVQLPKPAASRGRAAFSESRISKSKITAA